MITVIIQARMRSTRLPGKVLLALGDTTILGHTVRQVKKARSVQRVVVATSNTSDDDAIVQHCAELGVEVFRGDLYDVLDRYYQAAKVLRAENVCRITADCPLIDPEVIDKVVGEYEKRECDYISTGRVSTTFPDGMDVEVFLSASLERAWREAQLPSEREHVTPYIWNHPEIFRLETIQNKQDLSLYRLTLDEPNDYMVLQDIVAHVPELTMHTIVNYLSRHPSVVALNANLQRDSGYARSLQDERPYV